MWKFELKRVLFKKKGILIIAAALFLEILSLSHSNSYRADSEVEENKELYMTYMKKYDGVADKDRYNELSAEIEYLEECIENANNASDRYYAGEITRAQMSELRKKGLPYYDDLAVLKSIRTQYDYGLKDGKSGVIMYETGWILLLGRPYSNIIVPVVIILLIMPVFTEDYTYDMYRINDCCKNGKNKLFLSRITASVIIAFILCITVMAVDYFYFDIKYGLCSPMENISNIRGLKDSPVQLPLIINFMLTGVQMMIGSIIIIIITALFGQLLKNRFYGVVSAILLYIFPYIFFEKEQWVNYVLPISFFTDGGYVNGFELLKDARYVPDAGDLIKKLLILIFILSMMLVLATLNNRKKKNSGLIMILLVCAAMTGCAKAEPEKEVFLVSSMGNPLAYETGDILILMEKNGEYYMYIKDKKLPLNDNPFVNSECSVSCVTVNGEKAYYQTDEKINGNEYVIFYELDTRTMERKEIFKKDRFTYMNDSYLDINKKIASENNFLNCMLEFADDNFIIYRNAFDIVLYSRVTGKEKKILERADNLCIYQGKLYYTNRMGNLMAYDFKTENSSLILEEFVSQYCMCDKGIVYIDGTDLNVKLYNSDMGEPVVYIECETEKIEVNGNNIFYLDDDNKLSAYNMETGETEKIAENVNIYCVLKNRECIMYKDTAGNICRYDFNETNR